MESEGTLMMKEVPKKRTSRKDSDGHMGIWQDNQERIML